MSEKAAASGCPHPSYPEYEAEFGEDPARILYHLDPRPRIRCIDSVDLVRAYLDVETDRDEPRNKVVAALDERLQHLQRLERVDVGNAGPAAVATDGGVER